MPRQLPSAKVRKFGLQIATRDRKRSNAARSLHKLQLKSSRGYDENVIMKSPFSTSESRNGNVLPLTSSRALYEDIVMEMLFGEGALAWAWRCVRRRQLDSIPRSGPAKRRPV